MDTEEPRGSAGPRHLAAARPAWRPSSRCGRQGNEAHASFRSTIGSRHSYQQLRDCSSCRGPTGGWTAKWRAWVPGGPGRGAGANSTEDRLPYQPALTALCTHFPGNVPSLGSCHGDYKVIFITRY